MAGLLNFRIEGQPQLEKLVSRIPDAFDTTHILDEGAAVLFNRMRDRFLQEMDPNGERWVQSQAAINRAEHGKGGGTLFDSGRLFRSLQLFADGPDTRAIGTDATSDEGFPYPLLFQYGLGKQTQRIFLGFAEEDVSYMSGLVLKRLEEAIHV